MRCKKFQFCDNETTSIFQACNNIWGNKDYYDYEVDGLIFTPMNMGVGGSGPNDANELNGRKFTWYDSFKWKPPFYNTIDFLVYCKKDKDGKDLIRHVVHEQNNVMSSIIQYKTLILQCGFDKKKHKFMNPFDDVLYDNIPKNIEKGKNDKYEARPFVPTDPYSPETYLCNVPLVNDNGNMRMKTIEGETFDEHMIIEFQYDAEDDTRALEMDAIESKKR